VPNTSVELLISTSGFANIVWAFGERKHGGPSRLRDQWRIAAGDAGPDPARIRRAAPWRLPFQFNTHKDVLTMWTKL
jgi:hypothetical protein